MEENSVFSIFPNENFMDLCIYQCGWEKCKPGHSFGPATRNHYLFHYVISGTGKFMSYDSNGVMQEHSVKSGQGFFIFPHEITTYVADMNIPWEYTWIEFDGMRVKESLEMTSLSVNTPIYHANSKELRENLLKEMLYIVHHSEESPLHIMGHMFFFFDYLIESCRSEKMIQSGRMSDYYIKEAINFIQQNFQNDISVADMANICGIDRSYLGKIFKKSVGRSPQEFLINYRMVKATELLKLTSLSISDIGKAVGYDNQLHFSRAFKSVYGVSPRNWRGEHSS